MSNGMTQTLKSPSMSWGRSLRALVSSRRKALSLHVSWSSHPLKERSSSMSSRSAVLTKSSQNYRSSLAHTTCIDRREPRTTITRTSCRKSTWKSSWLRTLEDTERPLWRHFAAKTTMKRACSSSVNYKRLLAQWMRSWRRAYSTTCSITSSSAAKVPNLCSTTFLLSYLTIWSRRRAGLQVPSARTDQSPQALRS